MAPQRSAMRFVRLGALIAMAWTASAASAEETSPEAGPSWRSDYGAALAEAKSSDRLLWLQFTGPWCPNCLRMEQDSFPSPSVVARTRSDFVPVKLRADVDEELALNFNLTGLPATVIVDPSRNVLAVHQGYLGPAELDALLGRTLASHRPRHNVEDLADAPRLALEPVGPPDPSELDFASSEKPAKTDEHAELSGYCPVSLVAEMRLVEGQPEYVVSHRGRKYRFANLVTFNLFRRDPERYVPANDGHCPVEQVDHERSIQGDPQFGVLYRGRLYLCASDEDRERFVQEPERYATVGVEERGNCPHCLAGGAIVPGDPRYTLTQGGLRYWFPDEGHRSAFMSLAPSRTIRR